MRNVRRLLLAGALAGIALALTAPPARAGGGHGHGGPNVIVSVGPPGYWYGRGGYWGGGYWGGWRRPYYAPYVYPYGGYYGYYGPPPVVYAPQPIVIQPPAPVYIEREPAPPAPPAPVEAYWYYCPSRRAYYPAVGTCPEPWLKVAADSR